MEVAEVDGLKGLPDQALGQSHRNPFRVLFQLIQNCVVAEFKHKMQFSLPSEHFNQINQVWMLQVFQHADLSQSNLLY